MNVVWSVNGTEVREVTNVNNSVSITVNDNTIEEDGPVSNISLTVYRDTYQPEHFNNYTRYTCEAEIRTKLFPFVKKIYVNDDFRPQLSKY